MSPIPEHATSEETLKYIAQHIMDKQTMQEAMKDAVAQGIKSVVADPEFWAQAGAAMQQRAHSAAGGWLFAGIKAMFSRVGLIAALLIGLGMVGGWPAFWAGVKTVLGGHAP